MSDDEELTGKELYEKSRQASIDIALKKQKSLNMDYTGNIHVDYVNEHLDPDDNENVSSHEYWKYVEQAARGMHVAPDWYRVHWEHAMERKNDREPYFCQSFVEAAKKTAKKVVKKIAKIAVIAVIAIIIFIFYAVFTVFPELQEARKRVAAEDAEMAVQADPSHNVDVEKTREDLPRIIEK